MPQDPPGKWRNRSPDHDFDKTPDFLEHASWTGMSAPAHVGGQMLSLATLAGFVGNVAIGHEALDGFGPERAGEPHQTKTGLTVEP